MSVAELSEFDIDPTATALLVIDMQNDFCKPAGFFAVAGFDISPCEAAVFRTGTLIHDLRALDIPVFWSRSVTSSTPTSKLTSLRARSVKEVIEANPQVANTSRCAPGSWGVEIVDDLVVAPNDVVFDKDRIDVFHGTDLDDQFRSRGIDTIAIAGVTTNCCVETSVRNGFIRGFDMLVLSDCVAAFASESDLHDASLRNLALFFAVITTAGDFVSELNGRSSARGMT